MGKVFDYQEYFKANQLSSTTTDQVAVMVERLYPRIEMLLENEIARMATSKEKFEDLKTSEELRSFFDISIVTSLCWILSQYLVSLATRSNGINITPDNVTTFAHDLVDKMIKNFTEKKL